MHKGLHKPKALKPRKLATSPFCSYFMIRLSFAVQAGIRNYSSPELFFIRGKDGMIGGLGVSNKQPTKTKVGPVGRNILVLATPGPLFSV